MTDFLDINGGTYPTPVQPQLGQLEVAIDPVIQVGELDMAPHGTLLRIEHPRLGWISCLLSPECVAGLASALAARQ